MVKVIVALYKTEVLQTQEYRNVLLSGNRLIIYLNSELSSDMNRMISELIKLGAEIVDNSHYGDLRSVITSMFQDSSCEFSLFFDQDTKFEFSEILCSIGTIPFDVNIASLNMSEDGYFTNSGLIIRGKFFGPSIPKYLNVEMIDYYLKYYFDSVNEKVCRLNSPSFDHESAQSDLLRLGKASIKGYNLKRALEVSTSSFMVVRDFKNDINLLREIRYLLGLNLIVWIGFWINLMRKR